MNGKSFEFSGYVESINIKGTKGTGNQFLFSIINAAGDHHSYHLDPAQPARYAAMASLLTAAFAAGKIVNVNIAENIGHQPFASEIEVLRSQQ